MTAVGRHSGGVVEQLEFVEQRRPADRSAVVSPSVPVEIRDAGAICLVGQLASKRNRA